jgi:glutaredoxin 3
MQKVTIYTTANCPFCIRAKNLFKSLQVPFEEVGLDQDHALRASLTEKYKWRTVPMIVAGERFLGGFDDVSELHRSGQLTALLAETV